MAKTAVLLMNIGSPDRPTIFSVWRYLTQFLNDKRVIDLPWIFRKILVNCIIIPFRVVNSTRLYRTLWTPQGFPLRYISEELQQKLQSKLGREYQVFLGMRYGHPSYKTALSEIKAKQFDQLILVPLFPHYAMSTTESALAAAQKEIEKLHLKTKIYTVTQFYNDPKFIENWAAHIQQYQPQNYDHIVFSYHGLPNSHLKKCHPKIDVKACNCAHEMPDYGAFCYRATTYETSRLLAKKLNLQTNDYTVAFQSRLSKNWMTPFTDQVLLEKIKEGKKKILVVAPSFVTDCLETSLEIGMEYKNLFLSQGGEQFQLVSSLNAQDSWVSTLKRLIQKSELNKIAQ